MKHITNKALINQAGFFTLRRNLPFLFLLVLVVFSCKPNLKSSQKPELLLSEEQMITVLIDVHIVEASLNFKRNLGLTFDESKNAYYDLIFRNNRLTPELFKSNLQYYNLDPAQMEKIYEEVIARLSQMQSDALIEKSDSINKTEIINKSDSISD